jgi:hypothetical protein
MAIVGRKVANKNQVMQIGSGAGVPKLAATLYGPVAEDCWVTAFGGWVGTRGTPGQDLTIGAFTADADGGPGEWLGEASFTVNTELSASGAGESVELRQTVSNTGLSNEGIPLPAGSMVAIYVFSTGDVAVSTTADADAGVRTRDDVVAVPLQFEAHTVVPGLALDLYLEAVANNDVPVVSYAYLRDDFTNGSHRLSPFFNPSGAFAIWGGDAAVNFDRYDQVDEAHGDELSGVKLQLAPKPDDGSVIYERVLTRGEVHPVLQASTFGTQPVYDLVAAPIGPKLPAGVYFCRAQFADHFGAWSEWTPWLSGEGAEPWAIWVDRANFYLEMTPGLAPLGKVAAQNPAEFEAIYASSSNVTTTKAHLLVSTVDDAGVVDSVVISDVIDVSVTPGGTITIPWDGAWPDLDPGQAYAYRIRAIHQRSAPFDAHFAVSNAPEWQFFSLNALPTTPTNLTADNLAGVAGRPLLTAVAGDADDTPETGFGVRFRITRPDASQITVNASAQGAPGAETTNEWRYQTDATSVPVLGNYTWEAQSFNGADVSAWSAPANFTYADAPVVAITAPTSGAVISGASLNITWTSDSPQTAYRVIITDVDADEIAVDTGTVASATLAHAVSTDLLRHDTDYELTVDSTDDLGLTGRAGPLPFRVLFALPATPASFTVTPTQLSGDTEPTVMTLEWDPVVDPDFAGYRVTRQATEDGDDGMDEIDLALIEESGTTTFVDRFPASSILYQYRVRTVIAKGLGTVESAPALATGTITLSAVIIAAAGFGVDLRVPLRYVDSSRVDHVDDTEVVLPWGSDRPLVYIGDAQYRTFTGTFSVITDNVVQAIEGLKALRALHQAKTPICYRDNRQRKIFGVMRLQEDDRRVLWYVVIITVTETAFDEAGYPGGVMS